MITNETLEKTISELEEMFKFADTNVWHPLYEAVLDDDGVDVTMDFEGSLICDVEPATEYAHSVTVGTIEDEDDAEQISKVMNAIPDLLRYIRRLEYVVKGKQS